MHNNSDARMRPADALDVLRLEALMDRAVALPQNDPRFANRFRRITAEILIGIPHDHLVQRDAHTKSGISSKVLVRQKEDSLTALKRPPHHRGGIGAGADRAAMLAGKGLDGGCGIHVGDGNQLEIAKPRKLLPTDFHLADIGQVRHGAAGIEVRKNYSLVRAAKYVRAFGHEMHAAKNDIAGVGLGGLKRKLQRVPAKISELHHLIALVMMAEHDHVFSETRFRGTYPRVQRIVRHQQIRIEIAAYARFDFRRTHRFRLLAAN